MQSHQQRAVDEKAELEDKAKKGTFDEDEALTLAERTFSVEITEQLASDIIQYARRLHSRYLVNQQTEMDVSELVAIAREIVDLHAKRKVVLTVQVEALEDALATYHKRGAI